MRSDIIYIIIIFFVLSNICHFTHQYFKVSQQTPCKQWTRWRYSVALQRYNDHEIICSVWLEENHDCTVIDLCVNEQWAFHRLYLVYANGYSIFFTNKAIHIQIYSTCTLLSFENPTDTSWGAVLIPSRCTPSSWVPSGYHGVQDSKDRLSPIVSSTCLYNQSEHWRTCILPISQTHTRITSGAVNRKINVIVIIFCQCRRNVWHVWTTQGII